MAEHRRREIEEKRARLAEMRRAREERQRLLLQASASASGTSTPAEQPLTNRREVNDLVDSLLSSPRPASPYAGSASASVGRSVGSEPRSAPGTPRRRETGVSAGVGVTSPGAGSGSGMASAVASPGPGSGKRFEDVAVQVEFVDAVTVPAKIVRPETYSKSVQTAGTVEPEEEPSGEGAGRETEDEMRARIVAELDEERRVLEKDLKELKEKTDSLQLQHIPEEQRQTIFSAPEFASFLEGSSRIVQRALSDGYDYIKDYTIGVEGAYDESEGKKVKLVCAFGDERWTAGRSVTDLDWSPKFPELAVASYNHNPSSPNDPDGIVAVWNLHLLERPEFVFHSPSDVLSVAFSPFHPTLIFGGTYSGQVLLWDTRAKHLPVLKTPLSASGHTYPIYAMKVVGTQNANSLLTSSTDGLVCSWQADMLSQPQEALLLTVPSHNKTDEVSITCLDSAENETSTFWVGTEEGSVYQANRYDRASAKAGLNPEDVYKGHAGPVTGINFHPSSGSIDFSDLFLTSSVDWTVKLWRAKAGAGKGAPTQAPAPGGYYAPTQQATGTAPLHSFEEADDYVFDVKWHPSHPAVFGTADGTGKFDLWNLNRDVEVPLVSTQVSNRALNKLAWDRTPVPRKVGLGGSDGTLYVYDVAENIVQPRENEWVEMQKNVQGLSASDGLGSLQ